MVAPSLPETDTAAPDTAARPALNAGTRQISTLSDTQETTSAAVPPIFTLALGTHCPKASPASVTTLDPVLAAFTRVRDESE